jgi:molecular chaperone GrpE
VSSQPDSENPEIDGLASDADVDPLLEAEKRSAALKEQLLRTTADFDNFRKRSRREAEDAFVNGRDAMLKDLLPVFDNLERAVGHAGAAQDVTSLVSGIQMVTRQFADTLKRSGIERVPAVGAVFDPTIHEAIQQIETNEFPPGTIAAEVQAGYRLGERLFRPALVVVAKAPAVAAEAGTGDTPNQS